LIAEDNPTNRLLLNKILTRSGFELREANNGQAAIALWQEWQPHLIFMDMHMPILDGYNATRQIRELESYKSDSGASLTKIIALTASAFAEQRRKCFAAGCDDFVSKPFRQNDLLNLVTRHLAIEPNISALALDSSVDNAATEETEYVLVPSALEIMPTEWMDQFHMATAQGNDSKCLDLIAQIPQDQTSLIKALTSLVEQYQFDELLSLTTSSLSN
jgi:CheY-like chemotaxis protein